MRTNLVVVKAYYLIHAFIILASEFFDEVGCWLRKHNFGGRYQELARTKGAVQLKHIPVIFPREELKKVQIRTLIVIPIDRERWRRDR